MKLWNRLRRRRNARQPVEPDLAPDRIPPLGVDEYEVIIDYIFSEEPLPASAWMHLITFTHSFPTVDEKSLPTIHALRLTCRLLHSLVDVRVRRYIGLREESHVDRFFHNLAMSRASSEELPTLVLGIGAEDLSIISKRCLTDLTSADVVQIICRSPKLQWLIFKSVMSFNSRQWGVCATGLRCAGACSQVTRFDFLSVGRCWGVEPLTSQCVFDLLHMMPALTALLCGPVNQTDSNTPWNGEPVSTIPMHPPASPPPFRLTILTIDLGHSSVMGSEEVQGWLLSNSHDCLQSFALINDEWMLVDTAEHSMNIPIGIAGSSLRHLHLDTNDRSGIDSIVRCICLCPELEELAIPLFWHSGKLGSEGLIACLDAVRKPLRHFIVVGGSPTGPLVGLIRKGHRALANLRRVTCRRQVTYPRHDALEEVCKERDIIYRKI